METLHKYKTEKNQKLFEEAQKHMVGGGCAGGRINKLTGYPFYLDHARGSKLYTIDGEEFIDYHNSSGATLFGYDHPRIKNMLLDVIEKGFYMNFDSKYTLEFAKLFKELVPMVDKIRLTNSGSEATLAAIRVSRAFTGRKLVVRMEGHFHGMHEMIWFNHGNFPEMDENGEVLRVIPDSKGIPDEYAQLVKVIEFNRIDAVEHIVKKYKGEIAALIMEPVAYNAGCCEPFKEYMQQVREICTREGIVLIYDEVISGLRFRPGSAQGFYGVQADLSTFAKAIGNGFSIALVGGKQEIMDMFNPLGPVISSGTSTGNLMSVAAGVECLKMALEPGFYDTIERIEKLLCDGVNDLFCKHKIPGHIRSKGAQFGIFFGIEDPSADLYLRETIKHFDSVTARKFFTKCLDEKLYFLLLGDQPYPHHMGFSSQHTEEDITTTLERMDKVMYSLCR